MLSVTISSICFYNCRLYSFSSFCKCHARLCAVVVRWSAVLITPLGDHVIMRIPKFRKVIRPGCGPEPAGTPPISLTHLLIVFQHSVFLPNFVW